MLKLIDFYADWCGPCKIMTPILSDLEKEFTGQIKIVRVDVDQNTDLASKYGVLSIPTYVFEKNDTEVDRMIGAHHKSELTKLIEKYLNQ